MYQGTTPQLPLSIEGFDLTGMTVFVTIRVDGTQITKTGDDLLVTYDAETDTSTIIFPLTQEETLSMRGDKWGDVQVRFIDSAGMA